MTLDFQPPSSEAAIEWALAYARAGMAVFPLSAANTPAISKAQGGRGVYDATTDTDRIREFWAMFPHAEIGWGVPAAVVVVDLDIKKGKRGLKDFFDRAGVEPDSVETPIAVTASGGRHLVFDACARLYQNKVAIGGTGIDFRTDGGYIALPRKGNGRWWLKSLSTPLAPAPSWLPTKPPDRPAGEAKPFTGNATPSAMDALKDACEEIEAAQMGGRNDAINCASYHIGGACRREIDEAEAVAALVGAVERMHTRARTWGATSARSSAAIAAGKQKPWEEREHRAGEDRPLTFTGLLGIARAVSEAGLGRRRSVTRWGALRAGGLVRNRERSADLAHRVLFEAARPTASRRQRPGQSSNAA